MSDWRQLLKKLNVTREEFAHALSLALVEAQPTTVIKSIDNDVIELADGMKVYVQNLWRKFQAEPETIISEFERSARILVETDRPISRTRIIAAIRDEEWLSVVPPDSPGATQHLVADLWIVFGVDQEDFTDYPKLKDFEDAGIPFTELYALALSNLRRILPEAEFEAEGPVWQAVSGGVYETALLLLEEVWDEAKDLVEGEIIAAVPARDKLLFTGTQVPGGITELRKLTDQIHETGHHLVSRTLLIRKDRAWHPFADGVSI